MKETAAGHHIQIVHRHFIRNCVFHVTSRVAAGAPFASA
jgi:hypothetical protein